MQNSSAGVILGGIHNRPVDSAPAASMAAASGKRSFSQLLKAAFARARRLVCSASVPPASESPTSYPASLQGGKAALQQAEFFTGLTSKCVLCASDHPDPALLARFVGALPVGRKMVLPEMSYILGERFRVVNQDLVYLVRQLQLPILDGRRGILLIKPFAICKHCARIGAQARQNYNFSTKQLLPGSEDSRQMRDAASLNASSGSRPLSTIAP